jgi:hypothetical protein
MMPTLQYAEGVGVEVGVGVVMVAGDGRLCDERRNARDWRWCANQTGALPSLSTYRFTTTDTHNHNTTLTSQH